MDRFLIIDDHPLFREALQSAVKLAYPEAHVSEAASVSEALSIIESSPDFDLALLDLSMPSVNGFEGVLNIRARFPRLPVVVVSGMEDSRIIHEALNCGVNGYIPKSIKKSELADAIRSVMNGAMYVPDFYVPPAPVSTRAKAQRMEFAERLSSLTPQQLRVLRMLRQGLLNKQIAHELDVGETTVKAHVSEILRKLSVMSRTQAVIESSGLDFDAILGTSQLGRSKS